MPDVKEHWEFVARPPRHAAYDREHVVLTVHYEQDGARRELPGTLRDFSRGGVRLSCDGALATGIFVDLDLKIGDDFHQRTRAVVRWRFETPEAVLYGCEFLEEAPWEMLGELLLRGILALD